MKAESHQKLTFRCTQQEMELIEKSAKEEGCSKSEYVRDVVMQSISSTNNNDVGVPLILNEHQQQQLLRAVLIQNLLTQKKMTDEGQDDLWQVAADRAKEIVENGSLRLKPE